MSNAPPAARAALWLLCLAACGGAAAGDEALVPEGNSGGAGGAAGGVAASGGSSGQGGKGPAGGDGGSSGAGAAGAAGGVAGSGEGGSQGGAAGEGGSQGGAAGEGGSAGAGGGAGAAGGGKAGSGPGKCGPVAAPPGTEAPGKLNDDPAFLQVYGNNVENLELPTDSCKGEWQDLFHYIKAQTPSPDVFTVQQLSGAGQLATLVEYMTANLPGAYEGVIAEADPAPFNSPCGAPKDKQTNAIIYRTGRLKPVGDKHTWQSWSFIDGDCKRSKLARTINVMQKFHDEVADKLVTVASLHWGTNQGTGPDPACADKNMIEADEKLHMAGFGGALVLLGGDMNEPDRTSAGSFRPWYHRANGELSDLLGYADPIYAACKKEPGLQACLDDNWTIGKSNRIDFLLAQRSNGCMAPTSHQHTVTFAEADAAAKAAGASTSGADYSDHRALRSRIYY